MIAALRPEPLPQDAEAERGTIGSVLLMSSALGDVLEVTRPEEYATPANRLVLEAMIALDGRGEPIDALTVQSYLRLQGQLDAAGGPAAIIAYAECVPTAANARWYAAQVHDAAVRRALVSAAGRIVESTRDGSTADEALDRAEAEVLAITRPDARGGLEQVGPMVGAAYDRAVRMFESGETMTGLATGHADLDRYTAGLQAGDLVVLAARPAMGKTSYALNVAVNTARAGAVVAFFSLEMSRGQLGQRLICQEARIDLARFRTAQISTREWEAAQHAASRLSELSLYVDDDRGVSVLDLRTRARRLASARKRLDLVVVDYLGLLRAAGGEQNREREVSAMTRGLKLLAGELRVPVIALSQLNRSLESRPANDRRPRLADLRDSGSIEQDADVVLFVYRDEVYNPETSDRDIGEIIIAKHRQGGLGTVRLRFDRTCTRFDNLEERAEVVRRAPARTWADAADIREADDLPTRLDAGDVLAEARAKREQR